VVLVLHDLPLALRFADRIAVFQNGKLAAWDAPEAVYRSGILSQVFDVEIHRVETPYGTQYFCAEKEW
jgi:iron complex transport system ATP-binding protein